MAKKRVLVVGGAGFIGSNLVRQLLKDGNYSVEVVDNFETGCQENVDDLNLVNIAGFMLPAWLSSGALSKDDPDKNVCIFSDMADPIILSRIQAGTYDTIFLLAANPRVQQSIDDPIGTTNTNCTKTIAILRAVELSNKKTRVVFSSSCAVYGNPISFPVYEGHKKEPLSPYGLQKSYIEEYARMSSSLHNTDIVCLRYFNVYGPWQRDGGAYSTAITAWCAAIKDKRPLRFDGDGTQARDMIFVDDVVQANILAAARKKRFNGDCINIGTGWSTTNNYIIKQFKNRFDDVIIEYASPRPGDVHIVYAGIEKAKNELKFEPKVSLEEGLNKTFNWWEI